MHSDGFVLVVPPGRRFCSTQISLSVHPRSLQAATDLCSLLELRFLEDPPLSVPSQIRMVCVCVCVCVGSGGGVARISLNICDHAQNNCIMKERWTGGARRQEKPHFVQKKKWIGNRCKSTASLIPGATSWPGGAPHRPSRHGSVPRSGKWGLIARQLMCAARNVTMT